MLDNRLGDDQAARTALDTALRLDGRQSAALNNASALYRKLGMTAQAQSMQKKLQSVQREDPFAQYMQGAQAERAGDLDKAITYYRRAVRLYDTAHQFHFGLARVYFLTGRLQRADRELLRAQELGGWPKLVNRASMTWRNLPAERKEPQDDVQWLALIAEFPALVRRPLLITPEGEVSVGFNEGKFAARFLK